MNLYKIEAFWDQEALVWVAESKDVPGLVTEANSLENLTQKLKQIIPELLLSNQVILPEYRGAIAFELITYRQELIQFASSNV